MLKDAHVWDESFENDLALIYQNYELCKVYARTPVRPSVALPKATRFNEKVAMDQKKWGKHWILHLVDIWSTFTVSVFAVRKKPSDIIDKIMEHWVGDAFVVMKATPTDNVG